MIRTTQKLTFKDRFLPVQFGRVTNALEVDCLSDDEELAELTDYFLALIRSLAMLCEVRRNVLGAFDEVRKLP